MAVDTAVYSPHEYRFGAKREADIGTAVTTVDQCNIAEPVTVTTEIVQTLDMRSGAGRVLRTSDVYTSKEFVKTTVQTSFPIEADQFGTYMESVTNQADDANYNVIIASAWTGPELAWGATPAAEDASWTLYIASPETNKSRRCHGMFLTSVVFTADAGSDGGRLIANCTWEGVVAPSTENDPTLTAYGTTWLTLQDLHGADAHLKQITPSGGSAEEVVISKFELGIVNPTIFVGFNGTNPEVIARGMGNGLEITLNVDTKVDSETIDFWSDRHDGTDHKIEIFSGATHAAASFGVEIMHGILTGEVNPSSGDYAFFPLQYRATDNGTDDICVIATATPPE
jgi:hypothetical protein